ncbi:Protein of unknown function [Pyronema omphalodes CBS 100304]|uniref:Uncharacterized protein n=1 Tax=Pyronema omphalodes (strain CBS 100304) TaxID=1076935 RepID=U4LMX4_PYROM|nr:Protein of unknown function [Pyronema omphalodes CBS 100304]
MDTMVMQRMQQDNSKSFEHRLVI